jgi:hypothetical protein
MGGVSLSFSESAHRSEPKMGTYRNSEFASVKSFSVAEGNSARVSGLSLNAAKYTSYTALMSGTSAGRTTKPILIGLLA